MTSHRRPTTEGGASAINANDDTTTGQHVDDQPLNRDDRPDRTDRDEQLARLEQDDRERRAAYDLDRDTDRTTTDRTTTDRTTTDRDTPRDTARTTDVDRPVDRRVDHDDAEARDRFGGANWGACFFGWLVAIAVAILLTSIAGAVLAGFGSSTQVSQSEAQRQAGTIGIVAAVTLLVVLAIGYYAGGYVAGRMSRFDGGRQGFGVWLIGLLVTIVAIVLGAVFGSQYNLLDRVSLPRIPVSTDQIGWGAVITAVAVVLLTLLAAVFGGKVGHRYHDRVDKVARR